MMIGGMRGIEEGKRFDDLMHSTLSGIYRRRETNGAEVF